jgi:hypothetical protein
MIIEHIKTSDNKDSVSTPFIMPTVSTPGVDFLLTGSFFLSIPVFVTIALGKIHEYTGGKAFPTWALVSAGVASIPVLIASRIATMRLRHKREAAAIGAKPVPDVRGKWFGNADVLKILMHNSVHGYPGTLRSSNIIVPA